LWYSIPTTLFILLSFVSFKILVVLFYGSSGAINLLQVTG